MGRPLRGVARGFVGYLREVAGETAYDRYVEHRRGEHPDDPVMTRRDEKPGARCC